MGSRRGLSWFLGNTVITALGVSSLVVGVGVALAQSASSLEGTLEILHDDTPAGSRFEYFIHTNSGRYTLHFAGHPPTDLLTGARIRVNGTKAGNTLALGADPTSVQTVTPAPLPNALGEQRTLLILVNFADAPAQPYTPDAARSMMFDTTSRFYLENSFQQTWLSGEVAGWFTIAATSTVCDTAAIATQAEAAASAAGIDVAAYPHLVYAFPQNNACYFWGRSSVGGNPSRAWINGDFELGVTAHEFGHGLGLWHSHSMDCDGGALGTSCMAYEYGDTVDMMGASSFAHFNAFQKERLGWLNAGASPPIVSVQANGTYTLEAYELAGSGPKALKIPKSVDPATGKRTWYYVQSRQAIGFDAGLAADNTNVLTTNILNGLLILFGTESNGNSSYLLDMTPASGSSIYLDWRDPALTVGQTFTDPAAGVTVTADWVTATQAGVTVRFADADTSTTASGPTLVSVTTNQPSYTTGQTVAISATVKISSGSPVAKASVAFAVTKSNGTVVSGTATTGSNGVATYKLRLKPQDPPGSYEVDAAVTIGAPSAKAATTFLVQ
jgi:hypothetical protein